MIQRRDVLAQKLLQNLDKNHKFKNDKLLNFFEQRKKILKITGREEEPPYSVFHLKNIGLISKIILFKLKLIGHLRNIPDYKISTPKLPLPSYDRKYKKLCEMNIHKALAHKQLETNPEYVEQIIFCFSLKRLKKIYILKSLN